MQSSSSTTILNRVLKSADSPASASICATCGTLGIKAGSREHRDVADIFAISEDDFLDIAYHDANAGKRDYKTMPDADLKVVARNRELDRFLGKPVGQTLRTAMEGTVDSWFPSITSEGIPVYATIRRSPMK